MRPCLLAACQVLALALVACGGSGAGSSGDPGTPPTTPPSPPPPAPGTPPPATTPPPPSGGSGTARFQMASPQGLYIQDPLPGEPAVAGLVLVNLDKLAPPADTVVTVNGVPLARWLVGTPPVPSDRYWTLDPAGPRPEVRAGGALVLVATSGNLTRELVLPCPADVAVASTPSAGSSLAPATSVRLGWTVDLTVNPPGIPALAGVYPSATLFGFDPATQALGAGASQSLVGAGQLGVDVSVPATPLPAYLMELRWPGAWVQDGESGAWCGLVKRWSYAR